MNLHYLIRLNAVFLICILCTFSISTVFAQQPSETNSHTDDNAVEQPAEIVQLQKTREQLASIDDSIEDRQKQLLALKQKLTNTKDESKQKTLQDQIVEVEKAIKASEQSFKSIASGGIDLQTFSISH